MRDEIDELLESYHGNTLMEMCREAGLDVTDSGGKRLLRKAVAAQMRARYFTRERVLGSLARLSERERGVLDRLLIRGGAAPTKVLRRDALRAGLVAREEESSPRGGRSYEGDPQRVDSARFFDVVARLTLHGLVFSRNAMAVGSSAPLKYQFHPSAAVFVPESIRRYLPTPQALQLTTPGPEPDHIEHGDSTALLRDLYIYWDYVRQNETPLLRNELVGKRSLKAINDLLIRPDPAMETASDELEVGRLCLLRWLLWGLRLVKPEGRRLRATDALASRDGSFWKWSRVQQVHACLGLWSKMDLIPGWGGEIDYFGPRPAHARQTLMDILRTQPAGVWQELNELVESATDWDPGFLLADHAMLEDHEGSYYYGYTDGAHFSGLADSLRVEFAEAERRFVEQTVVDFLFELGMVDLGDAAGKRVYRLTELGHALLSGKEAPPSMSEGAKLIVQPNFQILAMGPVSLDRLSYLDLFAEREQADRGVFTYRLSRESLYAALQRGVSVPEVVGFLEQATGVELPQNVRRSMEEWGAHHERIVFRTGVSLMQAADSDLLDRLMGDPHLGKYLVRTVSPEIAEVRPGVERPLVAGLVELGVFPAISGAEPEAADQSVFVREDGSIEAVHAVPGLHLRRRLDRVAEAVGPGRWQLTERSVRRAGGSRERVVQILEDLAALHRGELPASVQERVRAWGGYYGDAAVQTLTLIEFQGTATLEALRADPELGRYLLPFAAGERALAVVPEQKLAELREALARFGVSIRDGLRR